MFPSRLDSALAYDIARALLENPADFQAALAR